MKRAVSQILSSAPSIDIQSLKKRVLEIRTRESEKNLKKKLGTNIRSYLNAEEKSNFLWFLITAIFSDAYRVSTLSYGNMTKEEHRYLKAGLTNLEKYTKSVMERLGPKEVKDIETRLIRDDTTIKIIDKRTLDLINQANSEGRINVKSDDFYDWCWHIMNIKCTNCDVDFNHCDLATIFVDANVPESPYSAKNCPFCIPKGEPNLGKAQQQLEALINERYNLVKDKPHRRDLFNDDINALSIALQLVVAEKQKENPLKSGSPE